ncbi:hypothetical protein AALA98_09300 [Lachnospiraceae bacterium 45-W7]
MRRKTNFSIAIIFIFLFMLSMPMVASAKNKPSINHISEYAQFGITKKNNRYFYKNKRIRIFFDERADHSFEYSFVDIDGTVDVRLLRNKTGNISKLKRIPKKKANKILKDMFGYVPKHPAVNTKTQKKREYTDIERCQLKDVPATIKKVIKKRCIKNKWYIIKTLNRNYIFKKVTKDFAFQIVDKNLDIRDIGKKRKTGPVLLSIGRDFNFTLTYNSKPVKSIVIKVKQ